MKNKKLILVVSLVLVAMVTVGGTLAWLADKSATVTNTFTAGDVDIELAETTGEEYKMVPGNKISKDPVVTVKAGSEESWVFVKVEEVNDVDTFLTYEIASGWTELVTDKDGNSLTGVYYREVAETTADTDFAVLEDDRVTVNTQVTKQQLNALNGTNYPKLVFTAYAVQKANVETAADAWAIAKDL